jgi:hypothetical protein
VTNRSGHYTFRTAVREDWMTFKEMGRLLQHPEDRDFKFYAQQVIAKGPKKHEIPLDIQGPMRRDIAGMRWGRLKRLKGFLEPDFK